MIDLKPYGAFILHTLKPLIEDVNQLLAELDKRGIQINERFVRQFIWFHFTGALLNLLGQVVCTLIVCVTLFKVFHA